MEGPLMESEFGSIRNRFPHYLEIFDALIRSDEDFRDACADYEECLRATADPGLERMHPRFRELCRMLEDEILSYLYAAAAADGSEEWEEPAVTIS
jgi:hypothetical protein